MAARLSSTALLESRCAPKRLSCRRRLVGWHEPRVPVLQRLRRCVAPARRRYPNEICGDEIRAGQRVEPQRMRVNEIGFYLREDLVQPLPSQGHLGAFAGDLQVRPNRMMSRVRIFSLFPPFTNKNLIKFMAGRLMLFSAVEGDREERRWHGPCTQNRN